MRGRRIRQKRLIGAAARGQTPETNYKQCTVEEKDLCGFHDESFRVYWPECGMARGSRIIAVVFGIRGGQHGGAVPVASSRY